MSARPRWMDQPHEYCEAVETGGCRCGRTDALHYLIEPDEEAG